WTTDEQAVWLGERKAGFVDAQGKGTTRAFINATTEAFTQKWPVADPTPAEIAEEGGNLQAAKTSKLGKQRNQIEWWFRNRTRATAAARGNGDGGAGPVIPLVRRKPQPLMPYQAYMHL
ncbi:hypothetical protein C8Q76DRAFT_602887, partial [Earliella scabrosa]